jgi:GAF domain-containing protein
MSNVSYLGRHYGDDTDWYAVFREAAKYPFGPSWLRSDLDVASGLADLVEQLRGTSAEQAIADAALATIEAGTSAERAAVWQLPWEHGKDAVMRLLNLMQTDRPRFDEVRGVPNVLWRLLQAYPGNAGVVVALRAEAATASPDPWILDMATKHAAASGEE